MVEHQAYILGVAGSNPAGSTNMTEQAQKVLIRVARQATEHDISPQNTSTMLEWVSNNPREFETLLSDFDKIIQDFNSLPKDQLPSYYINFYLIKSAINGRLLPTTQEMLTATGTREIKTFMSVMRDIDAMMRRGQLPEDQREEPYLRYHTTQTDIRNLVVAGIFHTYEEVVIAREKLGGKFERDRLVEALMEIASLPQHQNSGLFRSLSAKEGMAWVDDYPRFSEEFRVVNGFK